MKLKIKFINIYFKECYNFKQIIDLILNKLILTYIILNKKLNLKKNLILKMEYFQEKEDLEKLKNVKVKLFLK